MGESMTPEEHAVSLRTRVIDIWEGIRQSDRIAPSGYEAGRLVLIHRQAMKLTLLGIAVPDICKLTPFELKEYSSTPNQ